MRIRAWQGAATAALLLGAAGAYAQTPQKSEEGKMPGPGAQSPSAQTPQPEAPKQRATPEPKGSDKGARQERGENKAEPRDKASKGSAQREPAQQPSGKGATRVEPQEKSRGSAQRPPNEQPGRATQAEPKDKAPKGAEKSVDRDRKGAEQKSTPTPSQSTEKSGAPTEKGAAAPARGERVQLSEQQRTSVHQTLLKERNVNRAPRLNVTVNVGARLPRNVRLAALPAAIVAIVPEYRSYRYVVVDDRICIVEPTTYEVVEIITDSGRVAGHDDRGGGARLVLTEEERRIVLEEVDLTGESTLGLGALSEGADVPRNIELRAFPVAVVEQVPKLRGYKYFAAEHRLAIVGPQESKVVLVIDARR